MFKSKQRDVNITQFEHGRLSGVLASLWGNDAFALPRVNNASFVAGVALHDRGYGFLDNSPIGESTEIEWLKLTRKGFDMQFTDPVADLIARYHLRRLVRTNHADAGRALLAEMDQAITEQLRANHLSAEEFDRIDHVTNLLDMISFDFCFERPTQGERKVYPHPSAASEILVHYRIDSPFIHVDPWPFAVPTYSTFIIGYSRNDYPVKLEPLVIPVHLSAMSQ